MSSHFSASNSPMRNPVHKSKRIKNAVAVAVAGLHQRPLLVVGKYADFGLFSAGQGHGIAGIINQ